MSHSVRHSLIAMAIVVAVVPIRLLAADPPAPTTQEPVERLVYTPPPRSIPGARVNGVSRGAAGELPSLFVLSPDHVGLTVQEQPSVYWYLSKPARTRFVLTLSQDGQAEPLIEMELDASKAGIQRFDLHSQKVKLQAGQQYQLSLALIPDPEHRAKDLFCSALIKRVEPTEALLTKLVGRASPMDRAIVYARNGIWYDAMAILSEQIDADTSNTSLREQRSALLEQVNLAEAASFDRSSRPGK